MPQFWPPVTIASIESGEVVARATQASLIRNKTDNLRWLADSSGLVVEIQDDVGRVLGDRPPMLLGVVQLGRSFL